MRARLGVLKTSPDFGPREDEPAQPGLSDRSGVAQRARPSLRGEREEGSGPCAACILTLLQKNTSLIEHFCARLRMTRQELWAPWRRLHRSGREQEAASSASRRKRRKTTRSWSIAAGTFVPVEQVSLSSGDLMVAPYNTWGGRRARRTRRRWRSIDLPPRDRRAGTDLRPAGLQRRVEPRPGRRRGRRRPCPPARRSALGRRHQLHAGPGRRQGAPRASARDAQEAGRSLAAGLTTRTLCLQAPRTAGP